MPSGPKYLVIGAGRWGAVIERILRELGRDVSILHRGARQEPGESAGDYSDRLERWIANHHADIAWICIPPVPQLTVVAQAALHAGMHVVLEKPWPFDDSTTAAVVEAAAANNRRVAVHFQYCYLDGLQVLAQRAETENCCKLNGTFTLSRSNRLGISASINLGSHLVAIHALHFPQIAFERISVGYGMKDARTISLSGLPAGAQNNQIDFTNNREPLVQRFVGACESAFFEGSAVALDLAFARRVNDTTLALEAQRVLQDLSMRPGRS